MKIRITLALSLGLMALLISMPAFAYDPQCADCDYWQDCHLWNCPVKAKAYGFLDDLLPPGVFHVLTHQATPIRIFAMEDGLDCYYVGYGQVHSAGLLPTVASLAARYPPGTSPVVLDETYNRATEQPVIVTYLPTEQVIQIETSYADGKPYVFTIDALNRVEYLAW